MLGYEAQKAIIQELNVDMRRRLSLACPQIRKLNKTVHYKFDEVKLEYYCFQFDHLFWNLEYNEDDDTVTRISLHTRCERVYAKNIGMKEDTFFDYLLTKYLRPGTFIRKLIFNQERVSLSKHGPLNVEELHIHQYSSSSILKDIISAIDKNCRLKMLDIGVSPSSADIFDEPVVRNAEFLVFSFEQDFWSDEIADKFMGFRNKTLRPTYSIFSVEQVYKLGMSWICTKREIGTALIMPIHEYTFLCDVIDYFKPKFSESYMSKVISLGDLWFANSLTVPINEKSVLVVYGGEKLINYMNWSFRMEIMKKEDVRSQFIH